MIRTTLSLAIVAWLTLNSVSAIAEGEAPAPLAKPGETYVSLEVVGCKSKCPSFEIYVFDSGRMVFRPNNEYNAAHTTEHKSGMRSVYTRIAKYLQDSGAFAEQAPCSTAPVADPSVATVQAAKESQVQKSSWSSGCTDQVEKGRAIVKVFVNQTGMWRLINSDTRYWENYWETWEEKK